MWMDITVGVMAVVAFGVSIICYFEGFKGHDEK